MSFFQSKQSHEICQLRFARWIALLLCPSTRRGEDVFFFKKKKGVSATMEFLKKVGLLKLCFLLVTNNLSQLVNFGVSFVQFYGYFADAKVSLQLFKAFIDVYESWRLFQQLVLFRYDQGKKQKTWCFSPKKMLMNLRDEALGFFGYRSDKFGPFQG